MSNPTRSSRRQAAKQEAATSAPVSYHSAATPIDASSLSVTVLFSTLDDRRKNRDLLACLDFVLLPDDKLLRLFYKEDQHYHRTYDRETGELLLPPLAMRRTAQRIGEFFNMGIKDKKHQIVKYRDYKIDTSGQIKYLQSTFANPTPPPKSNRKRKAPTPPESKAVSATESDNSLTPIDDSSAPPDDSLTPPNDVPEIILGCCSGVTLQHVREMKTDTVSTNTRLLGFKHEVREAFVTRSELMHPNNIHFEWPYEPTVVGALVDGNDSSKIVWKVEEYHSSMTCQQHISDSGPDFGTFSIRHVDCTGSEPTVLKQGLCIDCLHKRRSLIRRFHSQVSRREGEYNPKQRRSLEKTTSLNNRRINKLHAENRRLKKRLSYHEKLSEKLVEETGVEVQVNSTSDSIFDESNADYIAEFLQSDEADRSAAIAKYVFLEHVKKYKQAKMHGRKSIRHSPLVIRLAIAVRQKMGNAGGLYDTLAECAGFPTDRNLRHYTSQTSHVADGILYENLDVAQQVFDRNNLICSDSDFRRHVVLAFDEMSTKGRFAVNHTTNEIVGVSRDAFERSIIEREFKELASNNKEDDDLPVLVPETTKHFLAFMATTLCDDAKKQQIFVARYNVKKTQFDFLARRIKEILVALYNHGFICSWIGNDGATECRSATKLLCTYSARDILSETFTQEELDGLPLDTKVAMQHPSPGCEDVKVVFGSDMPHWVKKFRNALVNKSRDLKFRGRYMKLKQVEKVWRAMESSGVADMKKYYLTNDHFELDSYKKMRVFLATQITSDATIDMIKDYCDLDNDAMLEHYDGMIELFKQVNRLIDIMNAYGANQTTKSYRTRDAHKINTPRHQHCFELLGILRVFEEWKEECGGLNKKFITRESYEDLKWLTLAVVCSASLYLKEDGSVSMHQGHTGSDVCEHFFALLKAGNPNPDPMMARQRASNVSGANAVVEANMFRRKKGTNTAGAKIDPAAYVAPLPTRNEFKRRKVAH